MSKYAELKDVRLTDTSAKCDSKAAGPLEAEFLHECSVAKNEKELLEVSCRYRFIGSSAQVKVMEIEIKYLVTYVLTSPEQMPLTDLTQFADANGTLHSWPFVREFLHSLTYRMGFPPFKLGVMHFAPRPKPKAPEATQPVAQS